MTLPTEDGRIRAALDCIPPDIGRDDWWRVGAAIKNEMGDGGFDVFDTWSRGAPSYAATDARDTWRSLDTDGGITVGTLYAIARSYGFNPASHAAPIIDANEAERRCAERERRAAKESQRRETRALAAAGMAETVWRAASPASDDHPYLACKGVRPVETLREVDAGKLAALVGYQPKRGDEPLAGRVLVAPVMADGKLSTIEMIDGDGRKSALAGGVKAAGFWAAQAMPETLDVLMIGEGVSTTLSSSQCTGYPAIAALSVGGMMAVAKAMRERYPDASLVLLADLDKATGKAHEMAVKAAQAVGARLAVPDFGETRQPDQTDLNDMHSARGADAVKAAIEAALVDRVGLGAQHDTSPDDGDESVNDPQPRYVVSDDGIFHVGIEYSRKAGGYVEKPPLRLSDRIDIVGRGEDDAGSSYRILRWRSRGSGSTRTIAFPLALTGEREGWSRLRGGGLAIETKRAALELLANYFQVEGDDTFHCVTERGGWVHDAYVLPSGEVIGEPSRPVHFSGDSSSGAAYAPAGDVPGWRDSVARLARGNSRPMLALGAAFAAPLLKLVDLESGGIHIFGPSGCGKTTSAKVGASVWGNPREQVLNWDSTALALTNAAAARNDGLMLLDEIGQGGAEAVNMAAYRLFNGVGKGQGAREGGNREQARWRVLVLSTGEIDLSSFMGASGKRVRAGQEVRLASLPADAGKGFGAFDVLNGFANGGQLAEALEDATRQHHGAVGRAFVEHVAANSDAIRVRLTGAIQRAHARLPGGVSGQVRRVASRFAVIGEALEIAGGAQLSGWDEGEADATITRCFDEWLARYGAGDREESQLLAQAEGWFGANVSARFIDCRDHTNPDWPPRTPNLAGYLRIDPDGAMAWLVLPASFEGEIAEGFDKSFAANVLERAGMLQKGNDGKATSKHRTPDVKSAPRRFYKFVSIVATEGE